MTRAQKSKQLGVSFSIASSTVVCDGSVPRPLWSLSQRSRVLPGVDKQGLAAKRRSQPRGLASEWAAQLTEPSAKQLRVTC